MVSLSKLKKELDLRIINPDFKDLKEIQAWFSSLEIQNIRNYYKFDDEHYCRVPLIANNSYDLLLCCWKSGQGVQFHGHPDQGCLVKILAGTLCEDVKYTDGEVETRTNSEGGVTYINDQIGMHRVN